MFLTFHVASHIWPKWDTTNGVEGGWNDHGHFDSHGGLVSVDPRPCYAGCSAGGEMPTVERAFFTESGQCTTGFELGDMIGRLMAWTRQSAVSLGM